MRHAVRIKSGVTSLSPDDLVMSCPLVAAYVVWDRQVLQPAAQETLQSPVTGLISYGTYSCRRMYGGADSNPSEHSRANALDIGEFKLADGRRITVLDGWPRAGPEAEFLRRVAGALSSGAPLAAINSDALKTSGGSESSGRRKISGLSLSKKIVPNASDVVSHLLSSDSGRSPASVTNDPAIAAADTDSLFLRVRSCTHRLLGGSKKKRVFCYLYLS